MKPKLLFILHRSPPAHGAAKVGDFIAQNQKLKNTFDCKFIPIQSSNTIEDIGKINLKKIYLVIELYIKILIALVFFKPDKIYFTASVKGVAFYRDLFLSTLWKFYRVLKKIDIYYHYHTKGIDKFVSISNKHLRLTNFFLKDINIILLSPLLKSDLKKINSYKSILYLSNGVEDIIKNEITFKQLLTKRFQNRQIEVLYLNHLIDTKGYKETLYLAKCFPNIFFNFAGTFGGNDDKEYFFNYIKQNNLKNIKYYGYVTGKEKQRLLEKSFALIYLSKNDAFPLTLLEALSFGLPIFTTNEGSIPYIIDDKSGIILNNLKKSDLKLYFEKFISRYINYKISKDCRTRYMQNFTLKKFENNLVELFK